MNNKVNKDHRKPNRRNLPSSKPDFVTVYSCLMNGPKRYDFTPKDIQTISRAVFYRYKTKHGFPQTVLQCEGRRKNSTVNMYPWVFRLTILNIISNYFKEKQIAGQKQFSAIRWLEQNGDPENIPYTGQSTNGMPNENISGGIGNNTGTYNGYPNGYGPKGFGNNPNNIPQY